MAISTKVESIESFIEIALRDDLSPPARSQAFAGFAREKLREAQDINRAILGRLPPHVTFVDGNQGAGLESVNPDRGVIAFEFELMFDVLRWIGDALKERSPVLSGAYRSGHTLFADGVEIPIGERLPSAEEYSFTNTVPWARKIEIAKTQAGRDFVISVPNRIYERTAKDARARYGNVAKIEFTYRGIVGAAQISPARAGSSRTHNKSSLRYPTIVITQPRN